MSATVRPVERRDLPRVWELVGELAAYERLSHFLTGSRERLGTLLFDRPGALEGRVAESDGRIVGYALFFPIYSSFRTTERMWLEDLYVEPSARGTGAGRELLAHLARLALERGCDRLDWYVLDWNQLAIDFYRRQGATKAEIDWLPYGMDLGALRTLAQATPA